MRCAKAKKILSDYLDDNLSGRKRIQLKAHLRGCPSCDAELAQLRSLSDMLQKAGEVEAPEGYWDNYWTRLSVKLPPIKARSSWSQSIPRLLRKPIPAAYALLAVVLVGLAVFFSDFYLDSRKAKSPEVAKAASDAYYRAAKASRRGRATAVRRPQSLQKESGEEDKKGVAKTKRLNGSVRKVDEINSKEMAAKRGETPGALKKREEIASEAAKSEKRLRVLRTKAGARAFAKEEAFGELEEAKTERAGVQTKMSKDEGLAVDAEARSSAKAVRKVLYEAPEPASANTPAMGVKAAPERVIRSTGNARGLQYPRKPTRGIQRRRASSASLVSSTLSGKYAEPYGLILRILKINPPKTRLTKKSQPTDAKLNLDISKGTDSDRIFLSALRKANPNVNLEFALSSKTVTLVGGDTSLAFKSGAKDYTFQLKILPPSDNQKEYRIAYLKNYLTPKPGETVMFDIPEADSDENNFVVLVTRFKP